MTLDIKRKLFSFNGVCVTSGACWAIDMHIYCGAHVPTEVLARVCHRCFSSKIGLNVFNQFSGDYILANYSNRYKIRSYL